NMCLRALLLLAFDGRPAARAWLLRTAPKNHHIISADLAPCGECEVGTGEECVGRHSIRCFSIAVAGLEHDRLVYEACPREGSPDGRAAFDEEAGHVARRQRLRNRGQPERAVDLAHGYDVTAVCLERCPAPRIGALPAEYGDRYVSGTANELAADIDLQIARKNHAYRRARGEPGKAAREVRVIVCQRPAPHEDGICCGA